MAYFLPALSLCRRGGGAFCDKSFLPRIRPLSEDDDWMLNALK